jgi:hypothetical protein
MFSKLYLLNSQLERPELDLSAEDFEVRKEKGKQ